MAAVIPQSLPKTMQAIRIHGYGNQDVLKLESIETPTITSNEVLIKVHAAAVNPVDWKVRQGYLDEILNHQLPLILGWDVAGEVVAIGAEVKDWNLGDAVYSRPNISLNGAYAEYIAINHKEIAHKPKTLNWQQAAAVPLAALTAWQALYSVAALQPKERVFIQAGSGGVGSFAIQLAKARGAYVITSCSSRNTSFVKQLGANEVIDYTQQPFEALRDIDVVFDTLGSDALDKSWQILKKGGRLVSIVDSPDESRAKAHQVESHFVFVQPSSQQLKEIAKLIDSKQLEVIIDSVFPLKKAAEAHTVSESGRARGKVILKIA